jgi:hypothetical protein
MLPSVIGLDWSSACALGASGVVLGLLVLLLAPARAGLRLPLALAGGLASMGAIAAGTNLPQFVWLPALALAAVWALALLSRPRYQGALLLVAGTGLLSWQLAALPRADAIAVPETPCRIPFFRLVTDERAYTDADVAVQLCALAHKDADVSAEESQDLGRKHALDQLVIRTGEASPDCNCHGWVFTGGRYWLHGPEVEQVLKDNGYRQVARPRPGDLAIYRVPSGSISHSGVVHTVRCKLVLIESKWGRMARYLHGPNDHIYPGASCFYYRSQRDGHLLRGLASEDARPPATEGERLFPSAAGGLAPTRDCLLTPAPSCPPPRTGDWADQAGPP